MPTAKPRAQIHMRMDAPVRTRKIILESAIGATRLQQYLKSFKTIRRQKIEQQKMFKQTIREVKELFHKIEFESIHDLPKKYEKPKKIAKLKKTKKKQEISKKQMQKAKKPLKSDKLERELADINKKLNAL